MLMPQRQSTWKYNALSDFTRLRTVRLLASDGSGLYAKEVAAALEVPPSHLSRHLQLLFLSGLVRLDREGVRVRVSLDTGLDEVASLALSVLACKADADVFGSDFERRLTLAPERALD